MKMNKRGFTLIELIIFIALFAALSGSFIAILLTVTRVQVRQVSVVEVSEQSQFLLQQIQYYIQNSSMIDMPVNTPTSTLKLFTGVNSQDPIYITLSNGTVYIQKTATGTPQPLSSNKVSVSNLTFVKHSNIPSHDSVSVSFTLAYNTSNIEQAFSQMLQTSVARVSAATFDSNLVPASSSPLSLGISGNTWNSINGVIYFSGSNVGIGTTNPLSIFDVESGSSNVILNASSVGIGTTAPGAKLEVNGNTMIDVGGSASHAVCWKADGKTLGWCSSIATSTGVCTCN
jgi:prepilin-type N-terminal cleavage/methylation domain-containing protein